MISTRSKLLWSKKNISIIFLIILFLEVALRVFSMNELLTLLLRDTGPYHSSCLMLFILPSWRQAMLGSNHTHTLSTTLPTPNIYSYLFLLAGKNRALSHIDPVVMYE